MAIVKGLIEKDYWAIQRESLFMFVMGLVDKDFWAIERESFFMFVKGLIEKVYWAILCPYLCCVSHSGYCQWVDREGLLGYSA